MNQELPRNYDSMTRLVRTTVEINHLNFHFLVNASKEEFDAAFPKVKEQVLNSVCQNPRHRMVLEQHRASLVYRYENARGISLGQFMIPPEHCK